MLLRKLYKQSKERDGFFLLDSLVGLLVLSIGLVGLALLYTQGSDVSVKAERLQGAVQVAGQEMERLKQADRGTLSNLNTLIAMVNAPDGDDAKTLLAGYGAQGFTVSDSEPVAKEVDAVSGKGLYELAVTVNWVDPQPGTYILHGYVYIIGN